MTIEQSPLNDLTPFEAHTVRELAELKTDMKSLVGNGQPGRVSKLEDKMLKVMIAVAILIVAVFGPSLIAWLLGG